MTLLTMVFTRKCMAVLPSGYKSGFNNKVTILLRWPWAGFHCIYHFYFRFIPCSDHLRDMIYLVQLIARGIPARENRRSVTRIHDVRIFKLFSDWNFWLKIWSFNNLWLLWLLLLRLVISLVCFNPSIVIVKHSQ